MMKNELVCVCVCVYKRNCFVLFWVPPYEELVLIYYTYLKLVALIVFEYYFSAPSHLLSRSSAPLARGRSSAFSTPISSMSRSPRPRPTSPFVEAPEFSDLLEELLTAAGNDRLSVAISMSSVANKLTRIATSTLAKGGSSTVAADKLERATKNLGFDCDTAGAAAGLLVCLLHGFVEEGGAGGTALGLRDAYAMGAAKRSEQEALDKQRLDEASIAAAAAASAVAGGDVSHSVSPVHAAAAAAAAATAAAVSGGDVASPDTHPKLVAAEKVERQMRQLVAAATFEDERGLPLVQAAQQQLCDFDANLDEFRAMLLSDRQFRFRDHSADAAGSVGVAGPGEKAGSLFISRAQRQRRHRYRQDELAKGATEADATGAKDAKAVAAGQGARGSAAGSSGGSGGGWFSRWRKLSPSRSQPNQSQNQSQSQSQKQRPLSANPSEDHRRLDGSFSSADDADVKVLRGSSGDQSAAALAAREAKAERKRVQEMIHRAEFEEADEFAPTVFIDVDVMDPELAGVSFKAGADARRGGSSCCAGSEKSEERKDREAPGNGARNGRRSEEAETEKDSKGKKQVLGFERERQRELGKEKERRKGTHATSDDSHASLEASRVALEDSRADARRLREELARLQASLAEKDSAMMALEASLQQEKRMRRKAEEARARMKDIVDAQKKEMDSFGEWDRIEARNREVEWKALKTRWEDLKQQQKEEEEEVKGENEKKKEEEERAVVENVEGGIIGSRFAEREEGEEGIRERHSEERCGGEGEREGEGETFRNEMSFAESSDLDSLFADGGTGVKELKDLGIDLDLAEKAASAPRNEVDLLFG